MTFEKRYRRFRDAELRTSLNEGIKFVLCGNELHSLFYAYIYIYIVDTRKLFRLHRSAKPETEASFRKHQTMAAPFT